MEWALKACRLLQREGENEIKENETTCTLTPHSNHSFKPFTARAWARVRYPWPLLPSVAILINVAHRTTVGYTPEKSLFLSFFIRKESHSKSSPSLTTDQMVSSKRSSITNALASKDAVAKVCFPLRRGCHVSSSRLMRLSLLENKDGIRTIEMILVSTILIFLTSCPLIYFGSATRLGS